MQLVLKTFSGIANSVDPDHCSFKGNLIWVCTVCICHFVRYISAQTLRTLTITNNEQYSHRCGDGRVWRKSCVSCVSPGRPTNIGLQLTSLKHQNSGIPGGDQLFIVL